MAKQTNASLVANISERAKELTGLLVALRAENDLTEVATEALLIMTHRIKLLLDDAYEVNETFKGHTRMMLDPFVERPRRRASRDEPEEEDRPRRRAA